MTLKTIFFSIVLLEGILPLGLRASEVNIRHTHELYFTSPRNAKRTIGHKINGDGIVLISLFIYGIMKIEIGSNEFNGKNNMIHNNQIF